MADPVIYIDSEAALRGLTALQKDQYPFALAKALTNVAKLARMRVQAVTREKFKLHGEFIPRGIRVQFAQKMDLVRWGFIQSAVYTGNKITDFMAYHETGGTKEPAGNSLAIPSYDIKKKKYRTSTGRVAKRWRPKTLLDKGTAKRKAFILPARGGKSAVIARRTSKRKRPLVFLYHLQRRAKIRPVWGFEDTVRNVAEANFTRAFTQSMSRAIASIH